MPKTEPAVHLIRRKAIDPPDEPLATPARYTTGSTVRTVKPAPRSTSATTLAKRARIVPPTFVPSGPSFLDRGAGIVREETVVRINGRKRVQSRIQRLEGMGDAPLPVPTVNKYLPNRDHSDCPRPEITPEPRVHCADSDCDCRAKTFVRAISAHEFRIGHADFLLAQGWMPAAVRAEIHA